MPDVPFPLLRAKLHQPLPAPSLVPRQRLLDKVLDRADATLILVSASAGSGKTTLVVQWLEQISWPVAWLSLDEADNDLFTFLSYFVAAIQTVIPEACVDTEKLLHAPQPPPPDYLAAVLVNDVSGLTQPFVLVLDDYHHVRDASIHRLIGRLLRHAPTSLRLAITSRFDPPLELSRLASRGKLIEIRAADLRFWPGEAQALIEGVSGIRLPDESVDALVEDFDGWAVGLQSAALSLRQPHDAGKRLGNLAAGDHRRLIGVMGDEVFAIQPAEVRDFLLRTSLLSQLTAPLCQVLLASERPGETAPIDSQAMLERLEWNSLFIEALDQEHEWYRYHNLFRSFLARKLERSCSAGEIAALHRRASTWYRAQGSADEAIRHALAAKDIALASDVVEDNLYQILDRERWPLLERWLRLFPADAIQRRPMLLVAQAWILFFQLKYQAIPPLLAQVESFLEEETSAGPAGSSLHCDLETLQALMFLMTGDFLHAMESAQRALCNMQPGRAFSRGIAVFLEAMALCALEGADRAVAFCGKIIDDPLEKAVVRARALESLCHIFGLACRPIEQERAAIILLNLAKAHSLHVSAAWAHRHLGSSYYERNELEMALHHFSAGVEQRYLTHLVCARDCYIGLALAYQAQGRNDEANAAASALQAFCMDYGPTSLPEIDSLPAHLAYLQGDTDRALGILERSQSAMTVLATDAYETATLTQAMIHVMVGSEPQRRAALSMLSGLRRLAEANHSTWYLIRILASQAIALHRDGQTEEALTLLQQAVTLGYPGRVILSFVQFGQPMKRLLRRLSDRGVEPAYLRDLLEAFPPPGPVDGPSMPSPGQRLVEPLSAREMEVLILLSQRLSNKEIAARLVVSPLTVKRHMTNIMQKLGVDSRWDAVEQARKIGLLTSP